MDHSFCCRHYSLSVKLIGKLHDGTIFLKKGHDEEIPYEFKIDEGNNILVTTWMLSLHLFNFFFF